MSLPTEADRTRPFLGVLPTPLDRSLGETVFDDAGLKHREGFRFESGQLEVAISKGTLSKMVLAFSSCTSRCTWEGEPGQSISEHQIAVTSKKDFHTNYNNFKVFTILGM